MEIHKPDKKNISCGLYEFIKEGKKPSYDLLKCIKCNSIISRSNFPKHKKSKYHLINHDLIKKSSELLETKKDNETDSEDNSEQEIKEDKKDIKIYFKMLKPDIKELLRKDLEDIYTKEGKSKLYIMLSRFIYNNVILSKKEYNKMVEYIEFLFN